MVWLKRNTCWRQRAKRPWNANGSVCNILYLSMSMFTIFSLYACMCLHHDQHLPDFLHFEQHWASLEWAYCLLSLSWWCIGVEIHVRSTCWESAVFLFSCFLQLESAGVSFSSCWLEWAILIPREMHYFIWWRGSLEQSIVSPQDSCRDWDA